MPAKAGIQIGVESFDARFLGPGFRRGDESTAKDEGAGGPRLDLQPFFLSHT